MGFVDAVQNILDRLIDDSRVLGSHGPLEDASSLDVLVHDGFQVFRLPERVLLEEELKVFVEGWDESNRLLAATLAEQQEVLDVLGVDDLLLSLGVEGQDPLDGGKWLVEIRVALEPGWLSLDGGETFLNTVDEVSSQLGE